MGPTRTLEEETIGQLLARWPALAEVLLHWGMACPGCVMAPFETLPQAARSYRRAPDSLLKEILEAIDREERARGRRRPAARADRETSRAPALAP